MTSRTRWLIILLSTPLVLLAAVGGLMGAPKSSQRSFPHLRVFEDVVSLITTSYVEDVDVDKVMEGAMRGLADGLDPMSAYLSPEEVRAIETSAPLPAGDTGLVVTRQFYLRVVGVRDGSPAAKAGLRTGDYIRGIDGKPTRELSAFAGRRALRGAPGSKVELTVLRGNAAEPHVLTLVREARTSASVTGTRLGGGEGYLRGTGVEAGAAAALRTEADALIKAGAAGLLIDLRGTADGPLEEGIAAARHFVKAGTLAIRAGRGAEQTVTSANAGDGALTLPVVLLVSNGTAGAAELFAAALKGNARADLVGEPTAGLVALQQLVKLPEGRGLWMTHARYLGVDKQPMHERGLLPTIAVEEPTVAFDETPPAVDDTLAKAIERLKAKKAA